jgi:SSS family solute:Na+ symporter
MIVWSLIAGMWSIATTDALQGLWMLVAATGLLLWVYGKLTSNGIGFSEAATLLSQEGLTGLEGYWPLTKFLAFTLPWVFFAVTNPQVVQRLYIPKDEASLARMIRWFALFGVYYTVVVTLIGLLARAGVEAGIFPNPGSKDKVTPTLLSVANPILAAIVFTSIVAAAVSTADSILLTLASSVTRDLAGRSSEKARRAVAIAAVVLVALVMAVIAGMRIGYIVGLSVLSSLMLLSIAPATVAAWSGLKVKGQFAVASVASGFVLVVVLMAKYGKPLAVFSSAPLGIPVAAWILLVSTLVLLAGISPKK